MTKNPQVDHIHGRTIGVNGRTFLEEVFCDFGGVNDDGVEPWDVE